MQYKISWLESHNPDNWSEDGTRENGIKEILLNFPVKSWQRCPYENDGWIEIECEDIFEADNIEEAKRRAGDYDTGSSDVFTVCDNEENRLFTEEDV